MRPHPAKMGNAMLELLIMYLHFNGNYLVRLCLPSGLLTHKVAGFQINQIKFISLKNSIHLF